MTAILVVLLLLGSPFGRAYNFAVTPQEICYGNSPDVCGSSTRIFTIPSRTADYVVLSISSAAAWEDEEGLIFHRYGEQGNIFSSGTMLANQQMIQYEASDCNGEQYQPGVYWAAFTQFPTSAVCRYTGTNGWLQCLPTYDSDNWPAFGVYERYSPNTTERNNGWYSICHDHSGHQGFNGLWVRYQIGSPNDTCPVTSDWQCKICSWPYESKKNPAGCGCSIDPSRYQSQADLQKRVYVYCNTYSGGGQWYFDGSRSNFDASRGEIYGACSNPTTGETVYMETQTCALGSNLDTGAVADSVGQDAVGTVPRPSAGSGSGGGSGSDTATHSRLDTIIGLIDDGRDGDSLAGLPDSGTGFDSVEQAGASVRASIESLGVSVGRTGGPWSATVPYPESVHVYMPSPWGDPIWDTTLVVGWEIPGFPFAGLLLLPVSGEGRVYGVRYPFVVFFLGMLDTLSTIGTVVIVGNGQAGGDRLGRRVS